MFSRVIPRTHKATTLLFAFFTASLSSSNNVKRTIALPSGHVVSIKVGDITTENVESIVNAANSYLQHGGGVAAAISRRGGPKIQEESNLLISKVKSIPEGQVGVTSGGNLKAKYVIHAVGPIWKGGNNNEDEKLKSAVMNSLKEANSLKINSIALPAISSGIFGYPLQRCCNIIVSSVHEYCKAHPNQQPEDIRLIIFDEKTLKEMTLAFDKQFNNNNKPKDEL
eukprot:TRINITY_DN1513_c0_g1_i2.p1 TRINITY_DN1513_c0_g1~~TRINITY_DN1513_c0_g1_i2.p1  ORF type:complete len:225 (-),score=46.95 TRINITY_DN1513_c0_g1_i2:35-709(-)